MEVRIALLVHFVEGRKVSIHEGQRRGLALRFGIDIWGRRRVRCEQEAYRCCPFVALTENSEVAPGLPH